MTHEQIIEIIYNHIPREHVSCLEIIRHPVTEQPLLTMIHYKEDYPTDANAIGPIIASLENTALVQDDYDMVLAKAYISNIGSNRYIEIHTTFER